MTALQAYKYLTKHPTHSIYNGGLHFQLNNDLFEFWAWSNNKHRWEVLQTLTLHDFQIKYGHIDFSYSLIHYYEN